MSELLLFLLLALMVGDAHARKKFPWPGESQKPKPAPLPPATPAEPETLPASTPASIPRTTPPWPAPSPPFPASWEPDTPVGPGVASRAAALLSTLWQYGAGTAKQETTQGRPIVYRATAMGQKKGVVAYRLKARAATPTGTTPAGATIALRTLRQGMRGDDVRTLQTRLGIGVDGIFGGGTRAAVIAYQRANGLNPDGVVGKNTWASLMGGARA
jgi:hypothetical protein